MSLKVGKIAVIGAGIMGSGIAQVCAQAGFETNIYDKYSTALQKVSDNIKRTLDLLVGNDLVQANEVDNILQRIHTTPTLNKATEDVDFVIEAIVEDISKKKSLFAELDDLCGKDTVLATNTSSFSISEVASATKGQERVVGMHWWNPPYLMPLIEIVKGGRTSEQTLEATRSLAMNLGKKPVVCKDSPGFLGVRLQAALVIEAIKILEEGLADVEDIDLAVRMSLGFRLPIIGPLQAVDLGGLDTFFYAYDYLREKLGDVYKPPDLLRDKVRKGDLGIKTGKGFYEHTTASAASLVERRDRWIMKRAKELQAEPTASAIS